MMTHRLQRLRTIDDFIALRENSEFYRRKNIILNIGRYDKFSKYNDKNITKYLREKQQVSVVPYNTLFFEACSEGTVIDLLLKLRSITVKKFNHNGNNQKQRGHNSNPYQRQDKIKYPFD